MAINYIPNDPVAALLNLPRREAARPNRSSTRARFALASGIAQGAFEQGTSEFLHWQTREAALNASPCGRLSLPRSRAGLAPRIRA